MGEPSALQLEPVHVDVLVVGAGQAGLGTAYWLRRLGVTGVQVLDAASIGEGWLNRWDSLRLFTPRRFSALPGLGFPPGAGKPTRVEMAAYLRAYADYHALPVATGHRVQHLTRTGRSFTAVTDRTAYTARHVVLATGPFSRPHRPPAYARLSAHVRQLHSCEYRRPSDVPAGEVVVVGGGNTAAQLALELADSHQVTVVSPRPPWFLPERVLGLDLYWWLYLTGTLNAGAGAPASRYVQRRGDAVIGTRLRRRIRRCGIRLLVARVLDAVQDDLLLSDRSTLRATTVLWCTGYRPDLSWLDVPHAVDPNGRPRHDRGASPIPGLHWIGLPWQTRLNSSLINGVDHDAHATAARIRDALA